MSENTYKTEERQLDGTHVTTCEDGSRIESNFHLGLLHGNVKQYDKNNELVSSLEYVHGRKHGLCWSIVETIYDVKTKKFTFYDNGNAISTQEYDSNGILRFVGNCIGERLITEFHKNGTIKSVVFLPKEGKGFIHSWKDDGHVFYKSETLDEHLHGRLTAFVHGVEEPALYYYRGKVVFRFWFHFLRLFDFIRGENSG